MAFLTISNGTDTLDVEIQSASTPRSRTQVGEVVETFGGRLKSTVRAYRRVWGPWDTPPLSYEDAAAIVDIVNLGLITISGDAVAPEIVPVMCELGWRDIKDDSQAIGARTIVTLTMTQVVPAPPLSL